MSGDHALDWVLQGQKAPPTPKTHKEVYLHRLQGCVLLLKYNKNGVGGTLFAPQADKGLPSAAFVKQLQRLVDGFESLVIFERWEGTQHYKFKIRENEEEGPLVIEELEFMLLCWLRFEIKKK